MSDLDQPQDPADVPSSGPSPGPQRRLDTLTAEELLPLVYDELRSLARYRLATEHPNHTLQATALVHEVYLRMTNSTSDGRWENTRHFFAAAAEAMKRIIIDHARAKGALKRGGDWQRIDLADLPSPDSQSLEDVLALDQALERLAADDARAAEIARIRLFAGLTLDEAATATGQSYTTAQRLWTYARAYLQHELRGT